jgi:hypothetical protein
MAGVSTGRTGRDRVLPDHPHGTRRRYQVDGCSCPFCVAANTAYMTVYRQRQRLGRPVLGAHVAGTEAATIVADLVDEGFLKAQIATWLGHRWPVLRFRAGAGVTLRTVLRLKAIQRRVCG